MQLLNSKIGQVSINHQVVLKGVCSFCNAIATFRQVVSETESIITGDTIVVQCEGCKSFMGYSISTKRVYPTPTLKGLVDLPPDIQKYYDEALRCLSSHSPNGAVTLFRKIIHALGIHYGLAKKNDSKKLYVLIRELHEQGHIILKLREALLGVKDIGNDGAHINENEPDFEQAMILKELIETVLTNTVLSDSALEFIKKAHNTKSNP